VTVYVMGILISAWVVNGLSSQEILTYAFSSWVVAIYV
jgi:uncharacterized membrane protein